MKSALLIGRTDQEYVRAAHVGAKIAGWALHIGEPVDLDRSPDAYAAVLRVDWRQNLHSFTPLLGTWAPASLNTESDLSAYAVRTAEMLSTIESSVSNSMFGDPRLAMRVSTFAEQLELAEQDATASVLWRVGGAMPKVSLAYTTAALRPSAWIQLMLVEHAPLASAILRGESRLLRLIDQAAPSTSGVIRDDMVVGAAPIVLGDDVVGMARITQSGDGSRSLLEQAEQLANAIRTVVQRPRDADSEVAFSNTLLGPDGAPLDGEPRKRLLDAIRRVTSDVVDHVSRNPESVWRLTSRQFEELVAEIYARRGFEVRLTPATRDGGADIWVTRHDDLGTALYLVECKKWSPRRPVGVDVVRALFGAVGLEGANAGVIVTTSRFTRDAEDLRAQQPFRMQFRQFADLIQLLEPPDAHGRP